MFRYYLAVIAALGLLCGAGGAAAQVTYNIQGSLYTNVDNRGPCVVGDCVTYTTAQRATASITFAAPLAPNLAFVDVSSQITAYSYSDGINSTAGPASNAAVRAYVITNSAGVVTYYDVSVQRTPGPPYTVNAPADPNSRISRVNLRPTASFAYGNFVCDIRATAGGPGECGGISSDQGSSDAYSVNPTTLTLSVPPTIPTLTEWAMILFGMVLAGFAVLTLQRRRLQA